VVLIYAGGPTLAAQRHQSGRHGAAIVLATFHATGVADEYLGCHRCSRGAGAFFVELLVVNE